MSSVPGPTLGPCTTWITGEDVAACCSATAESSDDIAALDARAVEASMVLYELSGRIFSGLCDAVTVRPCRQPCNCWGSTSSGLGAWQWAWTPYVNDWAWECAGSRCGCGTESVVRLSGYPVREIVEVKIGGEVIDPSEYELVRWRDLMRTTDPGPPARQRQWPACQDLGLPDTEPGTFSITYRKGVDPPPLGLDAAAELACELFLACKPGGECRLPNRVVQVVRQGVTIQMTSSLAQYLRAGASGLPLVDSFIAAYGGVRRRPAVFSPDLQPFARREA